MLLQVKDLIQIIVKFRTVKNICACFYHPHQTQTSFLMWWGTPQNIVQQILCNSNSKKERIDSLYFPEGKQIGMLYKTQFRYTIWFGISEKNIMRYTFLHCEGAHMYQKSQQARHKKKMCARMFNLSILKNYIHVYLWFL